MSAPKATRDVSKWVGLLFVAGAIYTLLPLAIPLLLAQWTAVAASPLLKRVAVSHRRRGAAAIATVVMLAILTPILAAILFLSRSLVGLFDRVMHAQDLNTALQVILASGSSEPATVGNIQSTIDAIKSYGEGAISALNTVVGATAQVAIGTAVFIIGTYSFLVSGRKSYDWLVDHIPIPPGHLHRFANAFVETGRGLFLGIGATALLQGLVAGIGYYVLSVPHAAALGLLTALAGVIPSVGAALVWAIVMAGLFIAERTGAGFVMLGLGLVISTGDNFLRPILTRRGDLDLPDFLVFISMIGGLMAFGGWGVALGPLIVRLAVEGLRIAAGEAASPEGSISLARE